MAIQVVLLVISLVCLSVSAKTIDFTQYVDVFSGSIRGGNNFPGVARPMGMVKLGPDLYDGRTDAYSGYLPTGQFSGFSLMHEQGTGGAPKYGTVSQLPIVGAVKAPLNDTRVGRKEADKGSVGYYHAKTTQGVDVELSAAQRAGIYRYTFPQKSPSNHIVVDVSHVLPSLRGQGLGQKYKGGSIKVLPDNHYEGHGVYDNGWNEAPNWSIFFCGYFDQQSVKREAHLQSGNKQSVVQANGTAFSPSGDTRVGALYAFDEQVVVSRVGISWISSQQACENVQSQIPEGTAFEKVVADSKVEWNHRVLSKIQTGHAKEDSLRLLYTSLYFMHLIPTNQTGENPGWRSSEPYYQDIFTFWDLFRCSTALMQVLQPTAYEEQIRSLIDIWRYDKFLPDARSSNYNGRTQGGSNADNVLADAYVKGVRGKVDWNDGYKAMVTDAEVTPPNNPRDPMSPDSSTHHGRGALPDWKSLHYITPRFARSVTRAVEYAANDFGLYQVAKGLNKNDDASKYLNRSRYWRNHFNKDQRGLNYYGFVVPRDQHGFIKTDPTRDGGYWADPFYECNAWGYSFADIHDAAKMIELMEGDERFISRLDATFIPGLAGKGAIFDSTNEPMFNLPYLYHFAGRQDLSVNQARAVAKNHYHTGPSGLPGNSDAGAMQTWLLWNMIGLYPITGQTTFLIGSPWFNETVIDMDYDKKVVITSRGGDGNGDRNYYVQSLKVNGKPWHKNWLTWEDIFKKGGTLEFELGPRPSSWSRGSRPPSPASEE